MRKIYVLMVFALSVTCSFAQEFKLGKVSKEELLEKSHPIDTSAAAAILYKSGKTYFEIINGYFNAVHETEFRIKIYKKEGYEYATDQSVVYTGGSSIRSYYVDAYTYNLAGDKIEKTKLKSDGEFEEKKNEDFSIKKITMPNVKEGSVIEYKHVVKTPYIGTFSDFYFQYGIPVNYVQYEVAIPENYTYGRYMRGYVDIAKSIDKKRQGYGGKFQENYTTFSAKNVSALKNEPYVNNLHNYIAILSHELAAVNIPSKGIETISTDWESVINTIYKHDDFGKELAQTSYFESDINTLIKGVTMKQQQLEMIYAYVQNRMAWNEKNSYYCNKGVKKAYAEKTGNTAEINLMLVAMLRHAGFEANPVLVSTRANGVALFPSRTAYNYVIAAVDIEGGQILLDATSKNLIPDMLPLRALNWTGRLVRKNGGNKEIELMPKKLSKEVINISADIDAEGKITGKARDQYFDYNAYGFREGYGKLSKDSYIESIEKKHKGMQVGEYNVNNATDLGKPVIEEYSFTHDNIADVIGDKIYFSPMLFFTQSENPFKLDKREFPVDFGYPHQDKYIISLKIPAGYAVESVPKSLSLAMEENIGSFKYLVESKANQINLVVNLDMNYANISALYYQTLKDFYQKMVEKQSEKIVLKKI